MTNVKRKVLIKQIKKEHQAEIKSLADNNVGGKDLYIPYFSRRVVLLKRCFADLFNILRQDGQYAENKLNNVQFSLKFQTSKNWFDYPSLFEELNLLFGSYTKIVRYLSGYKMVRIIDFEPKGRKINWHWRFTSLYICFTLLRLININNWPRWNTFFRKHPDQMPLKHWKDVIFIFHKHFSESKYNLDDELRRYWMDVVDTSLTERQFRNRIQSEYLDVIRWAFGSKYKFTRQDLTILKDNYFETQSALMRGLRKLKRSSEK